MVLNPVLFDILTIINNHKKPHVSNAGMVASFSCVWQHGHVRYRAQGEQYSINCPFCGDRRRRLYVHYQFGMPNPAQPSERLWHLAYCHNEGTCVPLRRLVEPLLLKQDTDLAQLLTALRQSPSDQSVDHVYDMPVAPVPMGHVIPLDQLPYEHPAVQYVMQRGFSVPYVAKVCQAGYLVSHPDPKIHKLASGRVVFPFFVDGVLRTWQGRLLYNPTEKFPPRWYFPPGVGSKVPWNVDVAAQFPVVIVCEGIFSALRMGPAAIAIGGKTLSPLSKMIIQQRWKRAFVALDADVGINRKPGTPDYQEKLVRELHDVGIEAVGVAWTPGDTRDPGEMSEQECCAALHRSHPLLAKFLPYAGVVTHAS